MLGLHRLPARMLENYVSRYEEGGVQPHPRLSFVDGEGRACIVGAMAGARSLEEFAGWSACGDLPDGQLERLSRLFEDGRITADGVYRECILELSRRRSSTRGRAGPGRIRELIPLR